MLWQIISRYLMALYFLFSFSLLGLFLVKIQTRKYGKYYFKRAISYSAGRTFSAAFFLNRPLNIQLAMLLIFTIIYLPNNNRSGDFVWFYESYSEYQKMLPLVFPYRINSRINNYYLLQTFK